MRSLGADAVAGSRRDRADPVISKLGYVDKAIYYLRKREVHIALEIFNEVEPDPSVETINRGIAAMNRFQLDVIIAIGGGSAIDAAKGMWLFYENPGTSFDGLKLKFMDIRKRAFHFPNLGKKAKLVAVPTTSGTGSEVTSFSVITDKQNGNIKYPLADYELTPDVAIIDPQFVKTMPKSISAIWGTASCRKCSCRFCSTKKIFRAYSSVKLPIS